MSCIYIGGVRNGYCNGDTNHVKRENTVKDLTQKLASTLGSPGALDADGNPLNRVGEMKGIISRAKEGKKARSSLWNYCIFVYIIMHCS